MIIDYLFWLFIYSFLGWVYESTLCSITGKKIVNRGFLNGPICPVYGSGAVIVIFCLSCIKNVIVLFFVGMILTCSVEYITSWLLEKIFHARWWDYSRYRFQINGRICLLGGIVFGGFSTILIKWIHPYIKKLTLSVNSITVLTLVILFIAIGIGDCIITVIHILKLNGKLKEIQLAMNGFIQESYGRARGLKETLYSNFEESKFYNIRIQELIENLNLQEHRLLNAFPQLKSVHYYDALEQLKSKRLNAINKLKEIKKKRSI